MSAIESAHTLTIRQRNLLLLLLVLMFALGMLVGANLLEIKDAVGAGVSGVLTIASSWRQP